jgi:hypothetical protein
LAGWTAVNPQIVYGEQGLDLVECIDDPPFTAVGEFTRYIYPFDLRPVLYIDKRDTPFLLGTSFRLASLED